MRGGVGDMRRKLHYGVVRRERGAHGNPEDVRLKQRMQIGLNQAIY